MARVAAEIMSAFDTACGKSEAIVTSAAGSLSRIASRHRSAFAGDLPHTWIVSIGRTAAWASARYGARCPVPMMRSRLAPGGESAREAKAETAAVRRAVSSLAFMIASVLPVSASLSTNSPAITGWPLSRFSAVTVRILTPV